MVHHTYITDCPLLVQTINVQPHPFLVSTQKISSCTRFRISYKDTHVRLFLFNITNINQLTITGMLRAEAQKCIRS